MHPPCRCRVSLLPRTADKLLLWTLCFAHGTVKPSGGHRRYCLHNLLYDQWLRSIAKWPCENDHDKLRRDRKGGPPAAGAVLRKPSRTASLRARLGQALLTHTLKGVIDPVHAGGPVPPQNDGPAA